MEPTRPPRAGGECTRPDAGEVVKTAVTRTLGLAPDEYDPARSLAEMGCDSLNVIDILYEMEKELGVRDLGLGGVPELDPLHDPVGRLEDHLRTRLGQR